jgi:uncharacterized protein
MVKMHMDLLVSRILKEGDLPSIEQMAGIKRQVVGPKYDQYIAKAIQMLKNDHACVVANMTDDELRKTVEIVDVISIESHGMLKRLAGACTGCGWCCSQTSDIVVTDEDATRISRQLNTQKDELFKFDGQEWSIKRATPCQWWNNRNGRCTIYNIRPYTCRSWPLGVNEQGANAVAAEPECNFSVAVLVHKVLSALEAASKQGGSPQ